MNIPGVFTPRSSLPLCIRCLNTNLSQIRVPHFLTDRRLRAHLGSILELLVI